MSELTRQDIYVALRKAASGIAGVNPVYSVRANRLDMPDHVKKAISEAQKAVIHAVRELSDSITAEELEKWN